MQQALVKIRSIYLPLFALAAGVTAVYSALNWFLVARSGLIPIDDQIVDLWIPIALSWALSTWLINPRLKGLRLTDGIRFAFQMTAWATVLAPLMIAQLYVTDAAGGITRVASTSQMATAPFSKFYAADRVCLDRDNAAVHTTAEAEGEYNENLRISLFVAIPACGDGASKAGRTTWVGLTYQDTISNRLSEDEKNRLYRAFVQRTQLAYDKLDPQTYRYFSRSGFSGERKQYEAALQDFHVDPANALILIPHTKTFEGRADGWVSSFFIAVAIALVVWAALLALAPLKDEGEVDVIDPLAKPEGEAADGSGIKNLLLPRREYYGLPILIDINVLVFLAMVLSGMGFMSFRTDDLLAWGANYGPDIHGIGVLRLISSQFVHGGLMHIASNMYGLLIVGMFLLPVAMNARIIALYLIAGLGGSIASVTMHPDVVSVGASGAIFGLCGVLLSVLLLNDPRLSRARMPILTNIAIYVAMNLAIGAATPGIDNAAHVGGLVTGLVLGVLLYLWDRWRGNNAPYFGEPIAEHEA